MDFILDEIAKAINAGTDYISFAIISKPDERPKVINLRRSNPGKYISRLITIDFESLSQQLSFYLNKILEQVASNQQDAIVSILINYPTENSPLSFRVQWSQSQQIVLQS